MKLLICDCDGVLLNWRAAFVDWLIQHDFMQNEDQWDSTLYSPPMDPDDVRRLIKIFNQTHYVGKLAPEIDAVDALSKAHRAGYYIRVVTAFSSEYSAMRMREQNLINAFGPIFQDIVSLPVGASKADWLKKQPAGALYVEDVYKHVEEAANVGFTRDQLYIIPHPWNRADYATPKYGALAQRLPWMMITRELEQI